MNTQADLRSEMQRHDATRYDLAESMHDNAVLRERIAELDAEAQEYADDRVAAMRVLLPTLHENKRLTQQVTALQTRCTELLELTRERDVDAHVRQLFRGYEQSMPETPCVPDEKTMRLRVALIEEEFDELIDAAAKRDLAGIVDACIDIIVVTIGMLVACGVRFWPMWWAVQRSNVAKFGGPKDANGKQRKPDGWVPPDVGGELRKQGFRE